MKFNDFKIIIQNNIKAEENDLRNFINSSLNKLPVPTVQVNKKTFIERAVKIDRTYGKFDLSRLSYIPKKLSHLVEKGRFNNDNEPTLYAGFTDLEKPSSTRFFLAAEIDQTILGNQVEEFNFTHTKWLSKGSFPSIFFVFKREFCNNALIESEFENLTGSVGFKSLTKQDIELFELITTELARATSANGYAITNIVFDFYKGRGYKSIIYPGVPGRYRGNNIAMLPEIFDNNFDFWGGAEFCLEQKGEDISINANYKIDLDNGKLIYSKFQESEFGEQVTIKK